MNGIAKLTIGLMLVAGTTLAQAQFKQDMKDAGHSTANAGKDVGHGTKVAAKDTAHGTKKAYHKTKHVTKKGYHKTENLGDRVADKPQTH
jgi:hypothetical protein